MLLFTRRVWCKLVLITIVMFHLYLIQAEIEKTRHFHWNAVLLVWNPSIANIFLIYLDHYQFTFNLNENSSLFCQQIFRRFRPQIILNKKCWARFICIDYMRCFVDVLDPWDFPRILLSQDFQHYPTSSLVLPPSRPGLKRLMPG